MIAPVKSVRLAKARMSKCRIVLPPLILVDSKSITNKEEIENYSTRSFKELQKTQKDSTPPFINLRVQPKNEKRPFLLKIGSESTINTQSEEKCVKRDELPNMSNSFYDLKKRIKAETMTNYFEDSAKFLQKEILEFEIIYSECIFDNSILVSDKRQTNLSVLKTKKFRSYRTENIKSEQQNKLNHKGPFLESIQEFLQLEHNLKATCSQIIQLQIICVSKKSFKWIIKREPQILRQFFENLTGNRQCLQV